MTIVVRTRTFPIFSMFFKSFKLFYPELVKGLIAQVQIEDDNIRFYNALAELHGFRVQPVDIHQPIHDNYWAHMLYTSLQHEEVVSLDDDVIFTDIGFFRLLPEVREIMRRNILAFSYQLDSDEKIPSSCIIYKAGIEITPSMFLPLPLVRARYEGVDSALFAPHAGYLENHIPRTYPSFSSSKNSIQTKYFIHLGAISTGYNNVYNKVHSVVPPR